MSRRPAHLLPLLALACAEADRPAPAVDEAAPPPLPLHGAPLLRRWSLDLRGVVPALDELDAIESGARTEEEALDALLDDPRVEERLVDLLAERWLTRVDHFDVDGRIFGFQGAESVAFGLAVGEEPLRLIAHILVEDRPWADVVTSPTTMAEETLGAAWPVDRPADAVGWVEVPWTDGRPALGVLATNGLWWRYTTSPGNLNRHRAAALSRLLLCEDYLERPVSIGSLDPSVDDSVERLIDTNPACVGCHSTLDPLSANLFGFWWYNAESANEIGTYHSERETLGGYYLGVTPAYFGQILSTPDALGPAMAEDPRLGRCAVQSLARLLWRRSPTAEDFPVLSAIEDGLRSDGFRGRALLRSILTSAPYLAGALDPDAPAADEETVHTARLMSASLYARAVADLTGFVWTDGGLPLYGDDSVGYRTLAGGIDGLTVTAPAAAPTLTQAAADARLAEAAAAYTLRRTYGGAGGLLPLDAIGARPGDPLFTSQLEVLHRRLFARPLTADEAAAEEALWSAVFALDGEEAAWAALLAGLLRDPAFGVY